MIALRPGGTSSPCVTQLSSPRHRDAVPLAKLREAGHEPVLKAWLIRHGLPCLSGDATPRGSDTLALGSRRIRSIDDVYRATLP
jgi:hypothetical protein